MMGTMSVASAGSSPEGLIAGLDDEQREAVLAPRGPLCVLAGAGTGKTRTITCRIAHLVAAGHVAPGQVLAVTFTQRAAGEMRNRLRELDDGVGTGSVQAVTFHAAARRQLQYFWPRVVGDTRWELLDTKFAVVAQAASRMGLQVSTDDVRDLAGEIEWAKASLITPEGYADAVAAAGRETPLDAGQVAGVYAAYEIGQVPPRRRGAARFRRPAAAHRGRDRERLRRRTGIPRPVPLLRGRRVPGRHTAAAAGAHRVAGGPRRPDGSRRREPDHLLVHRRHTALPAGVLPPISRRRRWCGWSATTGPRRKSCRWPTGSSPSRAVGLAGSKLHLVGQRDPGPAPSFAEHADEVAEAAAVAARISSLIASGTPASEIAVLYRINAQSEVYEEALTETGIPFQVRGGEGFFTRQEIRQALLALHRAAERGVGGDLRSLVRGLLEPLGLTQAAPTGARARERWEALGALADLVDDEVARRPGLDLPGLVAELRLRADARHPPVVQGVTLASLHAAKGLEWDAVFLVGLADGTLPISHALAHGPDSEAVEEERRLLYVGITRARVHLMLSWALARTAGGRQNRRPSRFLVGIAPQSRNPTTSRRTSPGVRAVRRPGAGFVMPR